METQEAGQRVATALLAAPSEGMKTVNVKKVQQERPPSQLMLDVEERQTMKEKLDRGEAIWLRIRPRARRHVAGSHERRTASAAAVHLLGLQLCHRALG